MIHIRSLTADDKYSFIDLMNQYTQEYISIETVYPVAYSQNLPEVYWEYLQKERKQFVILMAEVDITAVGFYVGRIHDYDKTETLYFQGNRRGEGLELYVLPDYRNRHIGQQLMRYMEQEFIQAECQHIVLYNVNVTNTGPQKLYERLGYIPWTMSFYKKI